MIAQPSNRHGIQIINDGQHFFLPQSPEVRWWERPRLFIRDRWYQDSRMGISYRLGRRGWGAYRIIEVHKMSREDTP